MICPICKGSKLSAEFTESGMVYKCLADGTVFADSPAAHEELNETPHQAPVAQRRGAVSPRQTASVSDRDVIRLARARLRELNAELKRMKKLESQRDAIKRLLAAADKKTEGPAVVRALRTNTGR